MADAPSPFSSNLPGRPHYSCVRCAARKVKCDRQTPCSACVKHNADCVFNHSHPPAKRRRRVKDRVLTDRLRYYEALLRKQGVEPNELPDNWGPEPYLTSSQRGAETSKDDQLQVPSVKSGPSRSVNKTKIVSSQGHSKFVENVLWTRMIEEFHDPEDALDDSPNDATDLDLDASDDDFDYVLNSQPNSGRRSYHPSTERIHQLWQVFVENIDPLTKVVHVPTLRPAIQKAASNTRTVPRSFEALMFSIYSAAVMSLKEDECKQKFGEPRKSLLSGYISATKAALSRAKFMGTTSLVVLQALILHIISVRDIYEPHALWSLTGVAVRIAQSMGLERDGESLGLPPFETEMRRRIWWLLKTHDFQTAELCGLAKFRDLDTGPESTKWPTNINDDEFKPGMPSYLPEANMVTDFIFIAVRGELAKFTARGVVKFREQGKNSSQWNLDALESDKVEMDAAVRELQEVLETKYIRYCDPSQPLQLMAMLIARCAMNFIRFLTHHPRGWVSIEQTPLSERQWIWEISIKLLEQHNMARSNPLLKQFAWYSTHYMQWHAFIHVLDTLQSKPLIADAEKAWQLVENTYEDNPSMISDTRKRIHVAAGNLCLKAYSAREAALQSDGRRPLPTPEFILQLRQLREVARAKVQARDAKSSPRKDAGLQRQANTYDIARRPDIDVAHSPGSFTQPGSANDEVDNFWIINGFVDSRLGNSNNAIDMTPGVMLAQDESVEDSAAQTIDWEQLDLLLADSNLFSPLSSTWDLRAGT